MNREQEPILRIRKVDYGRLGLKGNPFPIAGLSGTRTPYPLIDPHMDGEVQLFIEETLRGQEYGGMVILGDFGAGKTYALRYIETLLRTIETSPDVEEIAAIYVERPRSTVSGLVADVCGRIGRGRVKNILLQMIFSDLSEELGREDSSERLQRLRETCGAAGSQTLFTFNQVGERLKTAKAAMNPPATIGTLRAAGFPPQALADFATETLARILDPRETHVGDVARHLAELALAEDSAAPQLWNAFTNGRLLARGRSTADLSGKNVWSNMLRVLRHAGYIMVYWLVDEFEELDYPDTKPTSTRAFLADFRDLIDANLEGFALVLASKVSAWDLSRQLSPAFSQRFERIVFLPPNSSADLTRMIQVRLDYVRQQPNQHEPLWPFTKDAVEALQKASEGNTRVAVEACHILLWNAAATQATEINADTVNQLKDISHAFHFSRTN